MGRQCRDEEGCACEAAEVAGDVAQAGILDPEIARDVGRTPREREQEVDVGADRCVLEEASGEVVVYAVGKGNRTRADGGATIDRESAEVKTSIVRIVGSGTADERVNSQPTAVTMPE